MTLLQTIVRTCLEVDQYHGNRSLYYVHNKVVEEVGEAATEVAIVMGDSYKDPGKDGVVGESIDAIISLVDLIHKAEPGLNEEQLCAIAEKKCAKWLEKVKAERGV